MKIGILTFHCAHNYGAVLQAFALQSQLEEWGYQVDIIDYRPKYLTCPYKLFSISYFNNIKGIKEKAKYFLPLVFNFPNKIVRIKKFNNFIKDHLNLSDKIFFSKNQLSQISGYDFYFLGSDQIWNSDITMLDDAYFGNFDLISKAKRISYAASMSEKKIKTQFQQQLKDNLNLLDLIGVREVGVKNILSKFTNKHIHVNLDPTLLLAPEKWNKLVPAPKLKKKYVLIYQVRYNINVERIAQNMAKEINAEVIEIKASLTVFKQKGKHTAISPFDFLNLIKHAQCIVTTSFHGTAFSIIFNKTFYCVSLKDGSDNRTTSLLDILELKSRVIDINTSPTFDKIDFSQTNKILAELRTDSMDFIKSSLVNE